MYTYTHTRIHTRTTAYTPRTHREMNGILNTSMLQPMNEYIAQTHRRGLEPSAGKPRTAGVIQHLDADTRMNIPDDMYAT